MAQEKTFRDIQVTSSEIGIRKIGVKDLWQSLKEGYDDFNAKPSHVVFLIVIYPLFALLLTLFLVGENLMHLAFPMVAGLTLLGPVVSVGLFEMSRRRERGLDVTHHLIVAHDVINDGNDRAKLSPMSKKAKSAMGSSKLEVFADSGYFSGVEILECSKADITATLPKPLTSGNQAKGMFIKQDFRYDADDDVYICPAGEHLTYRFTTVEKGLTLRRYWTGACHECAIRDRCTEGKERRITRWEHEHVVEAAGRRLDENPQAMRTRRNTVEHPFGTIKSWMGATHFQMRTLK